MMHDCFKPTLHPEWCDKYQPYVLALMEMDILWDELCHIGMWVYINSISLGKFYLIWTCFVVHRFHFFHGYSDLHMKNEITDEKLSIIKLICLKIVTKKSQLPKINRHIPQTYYLLFLIEMDGTLPIESYINGWGYHHTSCMHNDGVVVTLWTQDLFIDQYC